MKKMKLLLMMLALAGASTAEAVRFGAKDWEVACDNTRRCEAVGYQTDESGSAPVALWLGRDAGAGAALEAKLSVVTEDDKDAGPLTIVVGKLSLAGLKAALLKMDDQQGRVGTTTALVKPGTRAASTVLPPLPAPTVRALAMPPAQKGDERLLAAIAKTIPVGDCSVDFRSAESAYNSGAYRYAKGRGVFDCGGAWDWVWTAQGFQLVDVAESNLCRGMPGGFMLREWTATVVK